MLEMKPNIALSHYVILELRLSGGSRDGLLMQVYKGSEKKTWYMAKLLSTDSIYFLALAARNKFTCLSDKYICKEMLW